MRIVLPPVLRAATKRPSGATFARGIAAVPICVVNCPGCTLGQVIATNALKSRSSRPRRATLSRTERLPARPRYAPSSRAPVDQRRAALTVRASGAPVTVSSPTVARARSVCFPLGRVTTASPSPPSAVAVPALRQRDPARRSTVTAVPSGRPSRRSATRRGKPA